MIDNNSIIKVVDFEDLIEREFRRISRIPLKERLLHYGRWMRHNKALTIAGGVTLAFAGGLVYEIVQCFNSTTNDIVKDFLENNNYPIDSISSTLRGIINSVIPEPSSYDSIPNNINKTLTNLESAFDISHSSKILELKNSLEQNLNLFEQGKPARPAYEFITNLGVKTEYLKAKYDVDHPLRVLLYLLGSVGAGGITLALTGKLKIWKDENYNKKIHSSKDTIQKTKTLLPQIYADLSTYEDRHIIFGVAYRSLHETKDADTVFKFLTSMRNNADAFFEDISDLYKENYQTLKQDPSSIFNIISNEDVVGIVNKFSGVNRRGDKLTKGGEPKKELILDNDLITFESIGSYEEIKDELRLYALALRDPYEAAMNGIQLETGIILWGHPGTGKTLLAQAFIYEALKEFGDEMQQHWEQVSGADIDSKWVGVGEQNVKGLYARARKNPPYIIFVDEGDVLFQNRDEVQEYKREIITQFLTEIGGTRRSDRVITVVTTNRKESFDTASTRYGRLGTKIHVDLPDANGRREIFDVHLNRLNRINLIGDLDYNMLIREMEGFSGADIAGVVEKVFKQRYKKMKLEGAQPYNLTNQHFIDAIKSYEPTEKGPGDFGFGAKRQVKSE